jgi:hypothetical protein
MKWFTRTRNKKGQQQLAFFITWDECYFNTARAAS